MIVLTGTIGDPQKEPAHSPWEIPGCFRKLGICMGIFFCGNFLTGLLTIFPITPRNTLVEGVSRLSADFF